LNEESFWAIKCPKSVHQVIHFGDGPVTFECALQVLQGLITPWKTSVPANNGYNLSAGCNGVL